MRHKSILFHTNKILLIGGETQNQNSSALNNTELYTLECDISYLYLCELTSHIISPQLNVPRISPGIVLIPNYGVFILGGYNSVQTLDNWEFISIDKLYFHSVSPTEAPSLYPTLSPTIAPVTLAPTNSPTYEPTYEPSEDPTRYPTQNPTVRPEYPLVEYISEYSTFLLKISLYSNSTQECKSGKFALIRSFFRVSETIICRCPLLC